jgi:maltose alpha-D-glucosyltransferase/alpha-amylase
MAFHFPLMPRMFMAIHQEDRFPIIDILQQTPPIPDNCQWALFLRNHDELTLEMVTDEERDYMYRAYARDPQMRINLGIRRRLAPLLGNNRRKIELMNALLLSFPGTPVIYYGDEIGMGDNFYLGDRNGVRTPMQWSSDRNAGFSRANPQKLYLPVIIDPEYHYEAVNVDAQQNNPHSLLWWIKRLIALRKRYRAFGRGSMEILHSPNRRVLAFLRRYPPQRAGSPAGAEPRGDEADECILVVANLSRFAQAFELDLAEFAGQVPVELFGRTEFPVIERQAYRLMLGPHAFYWFALERPGAGRASITSPPRARLPVLNVPAGWESVLGNTARSLLQECLPSYLATRRWFLGHGRLIKQCLLVESLPIPLPSAVVHLALIRVEYLDGDPETYVLPLAFAGEERVVDVLEKRAAEVVAYLKGGAEGVLYDAAGDPEFAATLLDLVERRRTVAGDKCYLQPVRLGNFDDLRGPPDLALVPAAACENNHTSVVFGQRLVLKLFRRVESGLNPEWEIGRYLMERHPAAPVSPLAGGLEYRRRGQEPVTVAVVHGHVVNEGDAWQYTLDELGIYFERVLASAPALGPMPLGTRKLLELAEQETPAEVRALTEPYLDFAWLLGKRTGELHALLASAELPALAPEPFTPFYQRSVYQSLRNLTAQAMQRLRQRLATLPPDLLDSAHALLQREGDILKRLHPLVERKLSAVRIRCHGDYHLGQVLFTGKDVVLIDFEGDPKRSLSERRIKRSPLRDVASMLRSFDYAASSALLGSSTSRGAPHGVIRPEDQAVLEPWARVWCTWASVAFWKGYLETARPAGFLPANPDELALWGDALLLEKALQELDDELIHRPDWVRIPLLGIQQLLQSS